MGASHIAVSAWTGSAQGSSNGGSRLTYLSDDENIKNITIILEFVIIVYE